MKGFKGSSLMKFIFVAFLSRVLHHANKCLHQLSSSPIRLLLFVIILFSSVGFAAHANSQPCSPTVLNPAFHPQGSDFMGLTQTARDVYVSGGYAYVASYVNGLRIVDVSNPESPSDQRENVIGGTGNGFVRLFCLGPVQVIQEEILPHRTSVLSR